MKAPANDFLICQSSVFAPDLHVTLDAQPHRRISKVSTSAQKPTSELVPFQSKIESNQIVSATRRDEDVQNQLNYFPKLFRPNFLNRKKKFQTEHFRRKSLLYYFDFDFDFDFDFESGLNRNFSFGSENFSSRRKKMFRRHL